MSKRTITRMIAVSTVLMFSVLSSAAVKSQQKTKVDFPGLLGGMVKFFGGKAAKEGVVSTIAVGGDRMMTVTGETGQLIDLNEEKLYEIEFNKKRYRVKTFEEQRQQLREAQEKMAQSQREAGSQPQPEGQAKEMEVDLDVKETGQTKAINGYDCRQILMTITMREKNKTLEQSGGIVLHADMWIGPEIPEMKEVADFQRRYAEKIGLFSLGESAAQMAMVQKMYPAMEKALGKFRSESADMSGTAIMTTMTVEAAPSPEQRAQQARQEDEQQSANTGSLGGLFGGLGRKLGKKNAEKDPSSTSGRSALMTTTSEVLSVSTSVAAPDVSIRPDFKEQN